MTIETAQDLLQMAVSTMFVVTAPVLAVIVLTSLVVNVLQTLTQLHDQSLAFIPRLVVTGVVLLLLTPWMLERFSEFATDVYRSAAGHP